MHKVVDEPLIRCGRCGSTEIGRMVNGGEVDLKCFRCGHTRARQADNCVMDSVSYILKGSQMREVTF